jgi:hypothetical protein
MSGYIGSKLTDEDAQRVVSSSCLYSVLDAHMLLLCSAVKAALMRHTSEWQSKLTSPSACVICAGRV